MCACAWMCACACACMWMLMCHGIYVKVRGQPVKVSSRLLPCGPGFELRSSGLVESTLPDWAIAPALEQLCLGWQTLWVFLPAWWDYCVIVSGLSTGLVQKMLRGLQPSSCDSVSICYCLQLGKGKWRTGWGRNGQVNRLHPVSR